MTTLDFCMFARAAVIAALYTVLTLAIPVASYGQIQVLHLGSADDPARVHPGGGARPVRGLRAGQRPRRAAGPRRGVGHPLWRVATLLGRRLRAVLRKQPFWLYMLPAVVFNGVIVGVELSVFYALPLWATMGYVALGEAISCYVLGYPLSKAAQKLDKLWN